MTTKQLKSPTDVARSDDLRRQNRRRVLSAIRIGGPLSRTDISLHTGLSPATVSTITSDLIVENVLALNAADTATSSGRGRPKTRLRLSPTAAVVGVINLQLNFVSAAIADYAAQIQAQATIRIDTHAASPRKIRNALIKCLNKALAAFEGNPRRLKQIAVGIQGTTDVAGRSLLWSPITSHNDLPIAAWLQAAFDVPATTCNDGDLIALELHRTDPDKYGPNFAAILLAHGVGMGLFLRGRPIYGTRSSGTEFGHMIHMPDGALCRCGSRGCIEAYAGDYAIVRHASGASETGPPPRFVDNADIEDIVHAATAGDDRARTAIERAGTALGNGLASMYALVDPFPIVLVGNGTLTRPLLEPAIRRAIANSNAARNTGDRDTNIANSLRIEYVLDSNPLVQKGGIVRALQALDEEFANAEF